MSCTDYSIADLGLGHASRARAVISSDCVVGQVPQHQRAGPRDGAAWQGGFIRASSLVKGGRGRSERNADRAVDLHPVVVRAPSTRVL
jgi:hypothetical protein